MLDYIYIRIEICLFTTDKFLRHVTPKYELEDAALSLRKHFIIKFIAIYRALSTIYPNNAKSQR